MRSSPPTRLDGGHPTINDAVTMLVDTEDERAAWRAAVEAIARLVGADAGLGLEIVSDARARVRARSSLPLVLDDEIPVAPDSQAAYVARADGVVISADLDLERRFVPADLLTRGGIRSSISVAAPIEDGDQAIFGAYWTTPEGPSLTEPSDFTLLARVAANQIGHLRLRQELQLTADRDPLTGLLSRSVATSRLAERLDDAGRPTLLVVDLDGFKAINDGFGHAAGDEALRTIADRIERAVPLSDAIGRLGGDEFMVVLSDIDDATARRRAASIIGGIEETIAVDHAAVHVSASVGIARAAPGDDAAELIRRADEAMYQAKAAGRGRVCVADTPSTASDESETRRSGRENTSDTPVDRAIVDEAIEGSRVVAQPIVDVRTGEVWGVEALARGPIGHRLETPDALFDAATTFEQLGRLELAIKRHAFDLELPAGFVLAVNLEPVLLADSSWLAELQRLWTGIDRHPLVVAEITERAVLTSPGRLLDAVAACRAFGWRVALDDLGASTESLAALRLVRPDVVKLDARLLDGGNPAHTAQVAAAVAAHRDGGDDVAVVAEGIEHRRHFEVAGLFDIDLAQGYLIGRPAPLEELDVTRRSMPFVSDRHENSGDRVATKGDLLSISRHIESVALTSDTVLLASLQRAEFLTRRTRRQYTALARRCGFVGLLGEDLSAAAGASMPGARIADLDGSDPLSRRWAVLAVSPTVSIALLATEIEDDGARIDHDIDRRFSYRIITDRTAVEHSARDLLRYF